MFFFRKLLIIACVLLGSISAKADNHVEYYLHNGSVMKMVWDTEVGEFFTMYYEIPRAGLGVSKGTVLLEGGLPAGGDMYVTARVFKSGCQPALYDLAGRFDDSGLNFTVRGQAPVWSGCRVVGYKWNNNSTLFFERLP